MPESAAEVVEDEERVAGHVSSAVYAAYVKAAGSLLVAVVLASLTVMQVSSVSLQAGCLLLVVLAAYPCNCCGAPTISL